jgi:hypothetical protein
MQLFRARLRSYSFAAVGFDAGSTLNASASV